MLHYKDGLMKSQKYYFFTEKTIIYCIPECLILTSFLSSWIFDQKVSILYSKTTIFVWKTFLDFTRGYYINFKEILSPSKTKNQRFCYFWGQYEIFQDIISDLTYKNFLYSETKRFLIISQIFSKIISFLWFWRVH